ncbi:MAG TPA: zinc-binding dehydrogenase [Ktedonobacteraceae bacterium]|nr:zinc-binding dehydrogenase [Ktedonobacteraceae bacterium]
MGPQERSWSVLKKEGVLVAIATPPSTEQAQAYGVRCVWFIVEFIREQLILIGKLIDAGQMKPIIDTVFPLAQVREAYEQGTKGQTRGKIVLRVYDEGEEEYER